MQNSAWPFVLNAQGNSDVYVGLKLIVDFVPNHTSNKHEWFDKTVHWNDEGNDMYKDYYIWRNASNWQDNPSEENRKPPNSWVSIFFFVVMPMFRVFLW